MARYFRRCPNKDCQRIKETGKAYQTEAKDHLRCPICDTELPPYDPTKATSPKAPKTKKIEEEKTMKETTTKKINPWWLLAVAVAIALITWWVVSNENNKAQQAERIAYLEATVAQQAENPATAYVPTGTTKEQADAAAMAAASVNYDGWSAGETKDLQPGWSARGDVTVNGTKYYDEGGVNEATVVVNRSSSPVRVYSQWEAGEVELLDYTNRDMAKQEFDRGGDYDASSVRIVEITDNEIVETWYRYKSGVVTLTKTLVHDR